MYIYRPPGFFFPAEKKNRWPFVFGQRLSLITERLVVRLELADSSRSRVDLLSLFFGVVPGKFLVRRLKMRVLILKVADLLGNAPREFGFHQVD